LRKQNYLKNVSAETENDKMGHLLQLLPDVVGHRQELARLRVLERHVLPVQLEAAVVLLIIGENKARLNFTKQFRL
jgi:hypothetical protein